MASLSDLAFTGIPNYDPLRDSVGYYFDEDRAKFYIDFIEECCSHQKGEWAGQKFKLDDWQKAIVANIYGWYDEVKHTRRYLEVLFYVPRKNGKTILCACFCVCGLFVDKEGGAEIYSAALEEGQAKIVWTMAKQMILNEPMLNDRCKLYQKAITKDDGSFFKPISADADSKHGFNSHMVVVDELHAQKDAELFDVLMTSTGSRRQPLFISATTADYKRDSVCNRKLQYARDVCNGTNPDPHFLPVIYEAPQDSDWTDPEVWARANPCYPISPKPEYLHRECEKAKRSAMYETVFKRLHLNIQTDSKTIGISLDKWDECKAPFNLDLLKDQDCYGGLDLSSTRDLSALVLYFPSVGVLLSKFYCPKENMREREKSDKVPYETWAREGFITATEGNAIDYNYIRQDVISFSKLYDIKEIGYDPYNARQLAIQLNEEDGILMSEFRQGFLSMNEPTKGFEVAVYAKKFNHLGHPVLRWCVGNMAFKMDPAGNIKPDKNKSTERIDGAVSSIMAYGLWMLSNTRYSSGSVYEKRGLLEL